MTLLLEYWKPVVGYEGLYEVSNCGNMFSLVSGRPLAYQINYMGYRYTSLTKEKVRKKLRINRLVARAFMGTIPEGLEVNHKDSWKINDRASNYEFITHRENLEHSARYGRGGAVLNPESVVRIRELANIMTPLDIASIMKVNRRRVYSVLSGESWSHVL